MNNFKACRVCLIPEGHTALYSMFSDSSEDAYNFKDLTTISVN